MTPVTELVMISDQRTYYEHPDTNSMITAIALSLYIVVYVCINICLPEKIDRHLSIPKYVILCLVQP